MLSMTVHAVSALIYPFRWQHIFLPVLPEGLLDYLEAPMPWIIGLPRSMLPRLEQMALEDVVVVNIDTGKLRMVPQAQQSADCFPWRERICENLQKVLDALGAPPAEGARPRHAATDSRCCEEGSDTEAVANVLLASVMRDFFLHLLGSYRCFVYELLPGASWLGNTETGPHWGSAPVPSIRPSGGQLLV
uniref:Denn domain-containing protein 1b n=1 Tax=Tetraselmis sp. GSL018 TaxID=582737 RepID=A0A061RND3_9CHLO